MGFLYRELSDLDLMTLVSSDDRQAFEEIYRRYKRPLYAQAYRMLESDDEAKDVLQEVFLSLWNKRHEIVLKTGLSPYLMQSVKYRILNIISNKKTENKYLESLAHSLEVSANSTEILLRSREIQAALEQEIALLPLKMRAVFELSTQGGLSYQEIGEQLGISDKTVKKQVHKARSILKSKMSEILTTSLALHPLSELHFQTTATISNLF
jgi:RNA polymerase sigma-70 factor (ECF subfamily)